MTVFTVSLAPLPAGKLPSFCQQLFTTPPHIHISRSGSIKGWGVDPWVCTQVFFQRDSLCGWQLANPFTRFSVEGTQAWVWFGTQTSIICFECLVFLRGSCLHLVLSKLFKRVQNKETMDLCCPQGSRPLIVQITKWKMVGPKECGKSYIQSTCWVLPT
jgi:hypothetical protein